MESLIKLIKDKKELLLYLVVGGLTTLVNWGVYSAIVLLSSSSIAFANAVAWIAAVVFAFVANKLVVFESKSWEPSVVFKEGIGFLSARIITGVLEVFSVPFLVNQGFDYALFGVRGSVAKITVSVIVVILNYFASKWFIFKKK